MSDRILQFLFDRFKIALRYFTSDLLYIPNKSSQKHIVKLEEDPWTSIAGKEIHSFSQSGRRYEMRWAIVPVVCNCKDLANSHTVFENEMMFCDQDGIAPQESDGDEKMSKYVAERLETVLYLYKSKYLARWEAARAAAKSVSALSLEMICDDANAILHVDVFSDFNISDCSEHTIEEFVDSCVQLRAVIDRYYAVNGAGYCVAEKDYQSRRQEEGKSLEKNELSDV